MRYELSFRIPEDDINHNHHHENLKLVGRPERKKPLGRPRRRWVDNVKMDLVEIGWGDVKWIDLAQDRDKLRALVNVVMNLWSAENAGKL
jgi:hypothetical protein